MKKIALLLLINCGLMAAQTKTVVTQYGEKVTISPNVNNGLTATNGYIQLGGALTQKSVLATTSAFTLALTGLQTGLGTDNVLVTDASTGVLKTISASAFTPYYWGVKGNSGTNPSTNFLGTTDGNDLVFKTNTTERMRIRGNNGFTGIGLLSNPTYGTTPNYMLDVVDDVHIISNRTNYTSARLTLENQQNDNGNQGAGIYMLDGQDNGVRREWYFGRLYSSSGSGGKNGFGIKSMQSNNLDYSLPWINSGVTHLYVDGINNRIGIGTITPSTALEVTAASNPLKLNGLQPGNSSTDQMLTTDPTGIVRKIAMPVKGRIACTNATTQVINDANVTAASTILLTYENPANTDVISVAVGTRNAGSNFTVLYSTPPTTSSYINYTIIP